MIQLVRQIAWQFLIFRRNNLVTMIAAISVVYAVIVYLIRDLEHVEKLITLLIYNDPAVIGFVFIGITIILEKDQDVLPALFVAPLDRHVYLLSRVITLSGFGLFGALAIVIAARGLSFNLVHFSIGAFATCALFSLTGVFLVSFTTEILHFLLRSIPLLIGMSLPLLNYFGLTDLWLLRLFPAQGGLMLMISSYEATPALIELMFGYVSVSVWLPLIYWIVYRTFTARVVKA